MKVTDSDRRWEVIHEAFAVCLLRAPTGVRAGWRYRRESRSLGAGEMQLMEPGEVHRTTEVSEPASFFVVRWQAADLNRAAAELDARGPVHFRACQLGDVRLQSSLVELERRLSSRVPLLEIEDHVVRTTRQLLEICAESPPVARASGHAGLVRARQRLDEHFTGDNPLDELAKEAGMTKFHFAHSFTKAFGVSPLHYQMLRRVEVARCLLRDGHSLREVSARTGFVDQSHLGRKFRAIFGHTPGAWARAMRRRATHSFGQSP
jgi:AraC-like DNA-binding protein